MALAFYADAPTRRTRQLVADGLLLAWCLLWVWIGVIVHDRSLVARDGARQLESGSNDLASNMTDAGNAVEKIPFVGGAVRAPFDKAASTGHDLATSGHDLATGLGRLSILLGVLTAAVPIVISVIPWCLTRLRYAVRAGRLKTLRDQSGGVSVLALEALTTASPKQLASISADPAGDWRAGDPEVTRSLAALVLATHGLRTPA